jgi:[ribosomal protein S18]-alanine N-acetyltransferase
MAMTSWFTRSRPSLHFAPLDTAHAPRLAEIHAEAFAHAWHETEFERLLTDRAILADGLFSGRDPAPVGFVLSRRVIDEAEILTVAVAASQRGRGQARPLLKHHLNNLTFACIRHVFLEVEDGNEAALALYRGLNFTEIGRRVGYYCKPDGSRACALTMRVSLPQA